MAKDLLIKFNDGTWSRLHDVRSWHRFMGKLKATGCFGTKYVYNMRNVKSYEVISGTKPVAKRII